MVKFVVNATKMLQETSCQILNVSLSIIHVLLGELAAELRTVAKGSFNDALTSTSGFEK